MHEVDDDSDRMMYNGCSRCPKWDNYSLQITTNFGLCTRLKKLTGSEECCNSAVDPDLQAEKVAP